jgi:hypothetical protein
VELSQVYHVLSALNPISFLEKFLDSINIYNLRFTFGMDLRTETCAGCLRRMECDDKFCWNSPAWNFMKIGLSVLQSFYTHRQTGQMDGRTECNRCHEVLRNLLKPNSATNASLRTRLHLSETRMVYLHYKPYELTSFYVQHAMGTKIAGTEFSLNPQGISSFKVMYSRYNRAC